MYNSENHLLYINIIAPAKFSSMYTWTHTHHTIGAWARLHISRVRECTENHGKERHQYGSCACLSVHACVSCMSDIKQGTRKYCADEGYLGSTD